MIERRHGRHAADQLERIALVLVFWLAFGLVYVTSPPGALLVCR